MDLQQKVFAIERPHPKLMTLYFLRSLAFPPFSLLALPVLYFRYHTMSYRFDEDGVSMRWGALFRREINHRGLSVILASRPCIHAKRRSAARAGAEA